MVRGVLFKTSLIIGSLICSSYSAMPPENVSEKASQSEKNLSDISTDELIKNLSSWDLYLNSDDAPDNDYVQFDFEPMVFIDTTPTPSIVAGYRNTPISRQNPVPVLSFKGTPQKPINWNDLPKWYNEPTTKPIPE